MDKLHTESLAELLARTLGPGWTPLVWENLGWHYAVRSPCGLLSVHPLFGTGFTAFLSDSIGGIGGKWAEHGDTPREAIDAVIKEAKKEYDLIGVVLKELNV
ncbi:hypothetical protein LCGC14_1101020 [marine sediment metagenome]|uniref:Uncharacterized protein n=1 Tax=marine sediment metagenome TaxID=412755 RepID=A0A0F9M9F6_9ZZZZ